MVHPLEAEVFLSARVAATRLGLPPAALTRLLRSGAIRGERQGGRWRIAESELVRWTTRAAGEAPHLSAITDALPVLIAYVDRYQRYRFVNKGYEDWWSTNRDALRGQTLRDVLGEATYATIRPHVEAALAGQQVQFEHTIAVPAGGARAVAVTYIPDRDGTGATRGFFSLVRDQTDREAALAILTATEERYRDLFDNADDVLYTLDLAGNVTDINRAAERLLGYTREEILGTPISSIVVPEHRDRMQGMLEHKLSGAGSTAYEVDVLANDGRRLTLEVRSRLLTRHGRPVGVQGSARDVTLRRQAEAVSNLDARRFRALIEHSHAGIVLVGARGGVRYAGGGVRNVLGYIEEELAPMELYGLVAPEDREQVRAAMRKTLAQPAQAVQFTARARHKDGRWRWVEGVATNLLEDDAVGAIVINIRDVSDQREAEAALHTSRDQLQAILQSVADGITVQDPSGRLLYANEAAARLIGSPSVEALLSHNQGTLTRPFRMFSENDEPLSPEQLPGAVALRTGRPSERVIRWQFQAGGGDRWSHVRAAPVRDEQGQVQFAVTAFQDISAIKQAAAEHDRLLAQEQAARTAAEAAAERLRRLQELTAALSEAITPEQVAEVVTERGTAALGAYAGGVGMVNHKQGTIVILRATGYTPADMTRYNSYPIAADNPVAEAVRTRAPVWVENVTAEAHRFPRHAERARAGTGSWAIAAVPMFEAGEVFGAFTLSFREPRVFSLDDREFLTIFARQCAQALVRARLYAAEREARAEAEASNRAKDEFLAVLSHELRTPLTPILGYTSMLRRRSNITQEQLAQALRSIERSARTQERLVGDLLDVSRIITGKLQVVSAPLALAAVVSAAVDTLRPLADEQQVTLAVELDADVWVLGDADRLQQVVWNLVANGIKFTPAGGRVQVRLIHEGDEARIVVSDTGSGIPAPFLPHVFDRFRQADSSSIRRHGGLGLGLAIVRSVVEMHGGTVQADSPGEGLGATFSVCLPAVVTAADPERALGQGEVGHETLRGARLLVVEDEDDTRHFLRLLLEGEGAVVADASSVAEAEAALAAVPVDVIVADVGLPGEDGYTFIRRLRRRDPHTPALALTAYASLADQRDALAAGFDRHLAKPVEPASLIAELATLMSRLSRPNATTD